MSGVAVIRYLIANNAAVLSALGSGPPVAASRVIAGDLPINTVLPAISVMEISSQPRNTVAMNGSSVLHTERVQVSVVFKWPRDAPSGIAQDSTYSKVKSTLALLLAACPHTHGTVNGVDVLDILPDGEGPDLQDVATSLYQGSRDFIVRWRS